MIIIKKSDNDFAAFKFLLRARSVDTIKPVFTCLFSDGKNAVCSDSRRLHTIELLRKIPAGLYDVIQTGKEIALNESEIAERFPNYKQVLNSGEEKPVKLPKWFKPVHGAQTLFVIMSKGICVNPLFVEDACKDCGDLTVIFTTAMIQMHQFKLLTTSASRSLCL